MEYNKKASDLPTGRCKATIKNRPISAYMGMFIFSIVFFFTEYWYFGLIIIIMIILSFMVTKNYTACKIYDDMIAVYNPADRTQLMFVKYDDIQSYELDVKGSAFVTLNLKPLGDDPFEYERVGIPTFKAGKLRRELIKIIPDKDIANIKAKEFRDNRLSNAEAKANRKALKEVKKKKVDKE